MRLITVPGCSARAARWLLARALRRGPAPGGAALDDVFTGSPECWPWPPHGPAQRRNRGGRLPSCRRLRPGQPGLTACSCACSNRDLFGPVAGGRYDVILANPPLPAIRQAASDPARRRASLGGRSGRSRRGP